MLFETKMIMQDNDIESFRIYRVHKASIKGVTAVRWEVVSQLKVGEAVVLPKECRCKMIGLAAKNSISIRTLTIKDQPDKIEIVRIPLRPKKKGT